MNTPNTITKEIKNLEGRIKDFNFPMPMHYTYHDAAKYIGRSYNAIKMLVYKGQLTAHGQRGRRYLRKEDLDDFMKGD